MGFLLVTVFVSVLHLAFESLLRGCTGPTTCIGVWIQELCSARSLRHPEQLLWPPLSLSSRSSLTSGRELLEARARVCLRSAPARHPKHAHRATRLRFVAASMVYQSSFLSCQCARFLKFLFESGAANKMKQGNCPIRVVAEASLCGLTWADVLERQEGHQP